MSESLDIALALAARGWWVFPLAGNAKIPQKGSSGFHDARDDEHNIRALWSFGSRNKNVGIATETSGLFVVDIDTGIDKYGNPKVGAESWAALVAEHGAPPETFTVRTPGGGTHLYFQSPETVLRSLDSYLGKHVDIKAAGGYVVAPGSVVNGKSYVVETDVPPAELPAWIVTAMTRPAAQEYAGTSGAATENEVRARVEALARELSLAEHGAGNDTASRIAAMCGQYAGAGQIDQQEVCDVLLGAVEGWHWSSSGDERTMRATITRQVEWGVSNPRAWGAADVIPELEEFDENDDAVTPQSSGNLAPRLPEEFWSSRPILAHIRQAAWSLMASDDAVLHCTLARAASVVTHGTLVETGIKKPLVLNLFTVLTAPSGGGKSSSYEAAEDLVPIPDAFRDDYPDDRPIGSGEGLAETFMGDVVPKAAPVDFDSDESPKRTPKTARGQARHNAMFNIDEGEGLTNMIKRPGTTLDQALRSAWSGRTLGQANAKVDTTRIIPARKYSMGLVMGFQPLKAGDLFDGSSGGTPQRLLFASATGENLPDDDVAWPGELTGMHPRLMGAGVGDTEAKPVLVVVEPELRDRIKKDRLEIARGRPVPELDAHAPSHKAKVAALLALLDGRLDVTWADWGLAETIWDTSCAVRTWMRDQVSEERKREAQARRRDAVETHAASVVAASDALQNAEDRKMSKWVSGLGSRVRADPGKPATSYFHTVSTNQRAKSGDIVAAALAAGVVGGTEQSLVTGSGQ